MRLLLLVTIGAALASAADEFPSWARDAASQTVPAYPGKVEVVVLLHDESVSIDADGKRLMRERGVIKVLQQSRNSIAAVRSYNTRTGKIRDFQGWLLSPLGGVTAF